MKFNYKFIFTEKFSFHLTVTARETKWPRRILSHDSVFTPSHSSPPLLSFPPSIRLLPSSNTNDATSDSSFSTDLKTCEKSLKLEVAQYSAAPLNGSTDNGSIRIMVPILLVPFYIAYVIAHIVKIVRIMVQFSFDKTTDNTVSEEDSSHGSLLKM